MVTNINAIKTEVIVEPIQHRLDFLCLVLFWFRICFDGIMMIYLFSRVTSVELGGNASEVTLENMGK